MPIPYLCGLLAGASAWALARLKGQTPGECILWAVAAFGVATGVGTQA